MALPLLTEQARQSSNAMGDGGPVAGRAERRVFLAGNPNSGKSTLFNALTGLRQKVANYPGVTVERRSGYIFANDMRLELVDLPGTYSLNASSEDEDVVRQLLLDPESTEPAPDLVVMVVDAVRLERNLFLLLQVIELGIPVAVALTMNDELKQRGEAVDPRLLANLLGVDVIEVHAARGKGLAELTDAISDRLNFMPAKCWTPSLHVQTALTELAGTGVNTGVPAPGLPSSGEKLKLWLRLLDAAKGRMDDSPLSNRAALLTRRLDGLAPGWRSEESSWRYREARAIARAVTSRPQASGAGKVHALDLVATHPVWGLLLFLGVMAFVFQSIFTYAAPLMDAIDSGTGWLAESLRTLLPAGPLAGLLCDGVIAGVGSVVIFVPQIAILFFILALLEDSGYLARAAAVMHKHMRRVGLHGRSFIPLMSGFACAIPGIMATRSIPSRRDRMVTMLVLPLMSCSARLPVYSLLIGAFIPATALGLGITWQGLTLWGAYTLSVLSAALVALVLRKGMFRGAPEPLIMELPPYRWPSLRTAGLAVVERVKVFLTQAGTVILALSIVLWFLLSFPGDGGVRSRYDALREQARAAMPPEAAQSELQRLDGMEQAEQIQHSFAGKAGHLFEPLIAPLGFDWKIGIGLIGSFAAREVMVSTLAVVYGVGNADDDLNLRETLRAERDPRTGKPVFSALTALSLIVFFVLACQCMSTLAIVKRETGGWRWPIFMFGYMTALAYLASLAVYQLGLRFAPQLAGGAL